MVSQRASFYCSLVLSGGPGVQLGGAGRKWEGSRTEPDSSHLHRQETRRRGFWEAGSSMATGSLTEVLKEGYVLDKSECAPNRTRGC